MKVRQKGEAQVQDQNEVSSSMGNWKNSPHHRLTGEFTGENISPVKYW